MVKTGYAHNAYAQAKISTATDPLELVIMLYDGAINFLEKAAYSIQKKDLAGKLVAINKTIAIIEELNSSLDMKKGGDIAANLHGLYTHMLRELILANIQNDLKRLGQINALLRELRGAWVHNRKNQPLQGAQPALQATQEFKPAEASLK